MPQPHPINHGPLVDQFFADLSCGRIQGVRPGPAINADILRLYCAWARANEYPSMRSGNTLAGMLIRRHQVPMRRKRYARGLVILGPHNLLFLGGLQTFRPGREGEELGELVDAFTASVDRYVRALESERQAVTSKCA